MLRIARDMLTTESPKTVANRHGRVNSSRRTSIDRSANAAIGRSCRKPGGSLSNIQNATNPAIDPARTKRSIRCCTGSRTMPSRSGKVAR